MKRASVYQDLGGGARGLVDGSTVTPVTTGPGQTVDQFRDEFATAEGNLEQITQQSGGLGKDAATASTSNFDMYTAVKQGLKSYDKAIAAIDKGASSGRIQSLFPSIKSSTIELENLRSKLGLDVVAASKFGALSEGELRLALEVAVPNLPGPELKKWLIDRKAAQAKLADYYKDVAIYLGKKGNTLPKYLEEMEAKTAASREDGEPAGAQRIIEVDY